MKYTVSNSGCWEFSGVLLPNGYGKIGRNKKTWLAHRYSYFLAHGEIPEGMCVLHKCDNRKCVNPDHLFLGTRTDNMQDMIRKGRQNFSKSPSHIAAMSRANKGKVRHSKIKPSDVQIIRDLCSKGLKQKEIASMFGIAQGQVSKIKLGQSWAPGGV